MAIRPDALYHALVQDLQDAGIPVRDDLTSCTTASEAAAYLLKTSFFKKFEEMAPESKEAADKVAFDKFLSVNKRCETWSRHRRDTMFLDCLVGYFKDEVHRFFQPGNRFPLWSTFEEILHFSRCGPGVSIGSSGTDFYTKLFSSDLTYTRRILETAYTTYFRLSPLWDDANNTRQAHGFGSKQVPGNRLTTVPKNVDTTRVIAVEPSLNMFFQLGLAEILTRRLRSVFSIDLSSQQTVNRELARRGSLGCGLATIDLESASDSMPWKMIQEYFPADIVRWFALLRSPTSTLPNGEQVQLHMISTMGNGFTFPLQTIVFCCAVSACYRYLSRERPRSGEAWSVFGDDIIVPDFIVGPLVHLIEHLGFSVNMQKSFFEGPFRESCGADFFRGQNVRGVYIKALRSAQSRCAVINQLNLWSTRTGIFLPTLVGHLLRSVPFVRVPVWDNDDAGVKVPFSMIENAKMHPHYQSIIYRRFESKPARLVFGEGTVKQPRGQKRRIYNPSGLFLAMLNGTLVSGEISVRHNTTLYRSRSAIAPNWEWSPTVSVFATEIERQRWETAVRQNFLLA
jgi:hypothetical protein